MSDAYKTSTGRLTLAGVTRIHELLESGKTYDFVAQAMNVAVGTVYNVKTGRTWGMVLVERVRARENAAKTTLKHG